ncbi:MAG: hypothetical protein ACFFCQ_05220 [Promethearchaeota archaeon]
MESTPDFNEFPLKKRVRSYIQELFLFYRSEFGDILRSMILFDSHACGTASNVSDVDILIIVSDSISRRKIRKIRGKIE